MCGIFGVADWRGGPLDVGALAKATNLLRHRGPDGGAYWTDRGVFFGHRRLAIIDLAGGLQPMASGDGRVVILLNGEIYNYKELREELSAAGVRFRTTSDTEALVEGYRVWGADVVSRLDGMFAIAAYDRVSRDLFLARDRFGEKPLLIAATDGRVAFSSEMGPLSASGAAGRDLDLDALGGYLCLNYVPGARTMLSGVERLPPATWRRYRPDGVVEEQVYWRASDVRGRMAPAMGEGDLLDALQARLDHAVAFTLRSDVPVGLFLSGGVDSALVAESAARQGHLAAAFCVDYAEAAFSEAGRAQHVADTVGVELVRVPLDAGALGRVEALASHLDDPLADSSAAAVWSVAATAAERVKVVLSGDGGDELFGGYLSYGATAFHRTVTGMMPMPLRYLAGRLAGAVRVDPAVKVGLDEKLRRFLRALPLPTREAHFTWNGSWVPHEAAGLVTSDAARRAATGAITALAEARLPLTPGLLDLQLADVAEYLPNDILAKVDRSTMAHGLESRAPFLDRQFAEFALSLPDEWKTPSRSRTKVLLRRLCARHFGENHARAPKQGFSVPLHHWLRTTGRGTLTQVLDRDRVRAVGILDEAAVGLAVADHLSGKRTIGWELWGLMVLVSWYEQRVASPPNLAELPEADIRPLTL
ncbi:MAG: asparagine synthase (glutamine-hydrolyzing) [Vicinamibacterales bacterium]|nr:asparagine synthase (glutamine-hydrolyzing) [Vicinamibacterales bacterium]